MDSAESDQIQATFVTKDSRYSVSGHPIFVQLDSSRNDLSELVKSLIESEQAEDSQLEFEFLLDSELLVGSLRQTVQEKSLSLDSILRLEFFPRRAAPKPQAELHLAEFVSCVRANGRYALASVYDGTVQVLSVASHQALLQVPAHRREVKCVDWIGDKRFVSCGHDQDCALWAWDPAAGTVACEAVCKGHADSVLCVCASPSGQRFASCSYDGQLKIWSVLSDLAAETGGIQHTSKRDSAAAAAAAAAATRLPLLTLAAGRGDALHAAAYSTESQLFTGGADASLRLWDCELGSEAACMRASAALLSLHCRQESQLVLAGCAAKRPRLYDPRSQADVLVASYAEHESWVSSVRWCPYSEQLFATGSYDSVVKVWDLRCVKAALYEVRDHAGIVTSVDWAHEQRVLLSAGADKSIKFFSAQFSELA